MVAHTGVKTRPHVLEFTKMSGAGNDFIVIDNRSNPFGDDELSEIAARICPRRTSVGADGLLALGSATEAGFDFRMVYFNADGSRGSMCGNGARCLSRFARLSGLDKDTLVFQTDAGCYRADVPVEPEHDIRLYVPEYSDYRPQPLLSTFGPDVPTDVHFIWTGTEHLVVFVEDIDTYPVARLGARLRSDRELMPAGANVNFVQVVSDGAADDSLHPSTIRVRTFEKGVEAETLACGTGAIASAVTCCLTGKLERNPVRISMTGGVLTVGFSGDVAAPVDLYLEGPAVIVYRGTFDLIL